MNTKITYLENFKLKLLKNEVLIIGFDCKNQPVNILSGKILQELDTIVRDAIKNDAVKGVVITSLKNNCFIAGADIKEIYSITTETQNTAEALIMRAHELFRLIDTSPKTFVAAIEGVCLGGGMELALACHIRVATSHPQTILGLPEVKLGIIPGFGGTQRLPKLIGIPNSLEMITTGKNIYPYKALKMGLIDDFVPYIPVTNRNIDTIDQESFVSVAIQRCLRLDKPVRKLDYGSRLFSLPVLRNIAFSKARSMVKKQTRGYYPAPMKAVNAIQRGCRLSPEKGCVSIELPEVLPLITSPTSKNLINIFFWMEEAKKANKKSATPIPEKVGVIGAGLMGSQIAANLSESRVDTVLKDLEPKFVSSSLTRILSAWQKDLDRKAIDRVEFERRLFRIRPTVSWADLAKLPLVIEAIKEILPWKQNLVEEFENICSNDAIFATNTSSYTLAEIADKAKHKERFVAMHFFNPVRVMKLVEIGIADFTSEEVKLKAVQLALAMGKVPIVVKDCPGFLVNRILSRYLIEAVLLVHEGVPIKTVDGVAERFGMAIDSGRAMGPLKLIDYIGVETAVHVINSLSKLGPRIQKPDLLNNDNLQLYFWKDGSENTDLIGSIKQGKVLSQEEVEKRLILPMVDEASRCLAEGIVSRPQDIDLAMILGVGFPAFRGGLMTWARKVGFSKINEELEVLRSKYGQRFEPCQLLSEDKNI